MRYLTLSSVSAFAILLSACGGGSSSSSSSGLGANPNNNAPVVTVAGDQSVKERSNVILSASATDVDGDDLLHSWIQISGPEVPMNNRHTLTAEFRAPDVSNPTDLVFQFVTTDGKGARITRDVTITVNDTPRNGGSSQGIPAGGHTGPDTTRPPVMFNGVEIRKVDGVGNNEDNILWGTPEQPLQRIAPVGYADGISSLAGATRPSAREISNTIHNQAAGTSIPNSFNGSDFIWQWGQFIDHDIGLTDGVGDSADIIVPEDDALFDPNGTGEMVIPLSRAIFDETTGTSVSNPRQQINEITSWIDGSMVYGSDYGRIEALRDPENPHLLLVQAGNLMPVNTAGLTNANPFDATNLFLAGDVRANEQVGLAAMHTLLVREHNRLAALAVDFDPNADLDDVFETVRRHIIGVVQYITYEEWLPALVGENAMPAYTGYKDDINPTIYNEFSSAAFRLGHTMINENLLRLDADGNPIAAGPLPLKNAFFSAPNILTTQDSLDPFLRGMAAQIHQEIDPFIVNDLRNFLFGMPGSGGLDLASLNIQRGRDHGVASYNDMREALGLARRTDFAQVSTDAAIVASLTAAYDSVDDIDLWTGGLSEDHVSGSQLGELFQAIIVKQFTELRDGDRFWYKAYLPPEDIARVESTTLSQLIRDNTAIADGEIQDNVFFVQD